MKSFVREKRIYCGSEYMFPEIFQFSENRSTSVKGRRKKKQKETGPKQKNLNDARAKRYFLQLAHGNFGKSDLVVHLTFADEYYPATPEEAMEILTKFLRRIAYERKRLKLPPLKYMAVIQVGRKKDGTHRLHFHVLMNGGLDRDAVENMWWVHKGTKKNQFKDRILYGWANADRLRPNKKGISQMAGYMMLDSAGKKHWTQSQNLEFPWSRKNDSKYSRREIQKICSIPEDCEDYLKYWEKQYPGYEYISSERKYSDETGWSVYLMMRLRS